MGKAPEMESGSILAKVGAFSGGAALVLGAAGLAGWLTRLRTLASLWPEYVPMAPDTGLLFLMLGAILFSGACGEKRRLGRSLAVGLASLASLYGALKAFETLLGVDLTFQSVLFPDTERLGAIVLGRMSPVTGLLFFLSGLALLACLLGRNRLLPREAATGIGFLVLTAGAVAVTGYLFGTPFLYGGATIPMAATTSAGFLFLGLGLSAAAGKDTVLTHWVSGPSASARLLRGILPIIVLAILLEGLLGTRLAGVLGVNKALLSAVLTLAFMAVAVVVIVRIARSVFRRAEQAESARLRAEATLRASEKRYRSLFENNHAAMLIIDPDGGAIVDANPAAVAYYGWTREELRLMNISAINTLPPMEVQAEMDRARRDQRKHFFFRHRRADGSVRNVEVFSGPITLEERPLLYSIVHDVTERKMAEDALRDSVKQKEILMKELQHRVKNSLAVVSGLLGLEMESLTEPRSREIFANTRSRIRSIASLYERLYSTADIDRVDLGPYLKDLAESLIRTYVSEAGNIRLETRLDNIRLDTRRAVPLGLILNELVTNSLKYACPACAKAEIRIDLEVSGDLVTLGVSDDGPGMPEGFDPKTSGGMGWSLVRMLTEEIDGELSCPAGPRGARSLVRFKL